MVSLRHADNKVLNDVLDMHGGYVLNFSDRTLAEYFDDEFGIDIYQEKYRFHGTSKAKHLRAFIEVEDAHVVSKVLRGLWAFRDTLPFYRDAEDYEALKRRYFDLLSKIEGSGDFARTDAIDRFKQDETLEELVAAIERDVAAKKPAAALDRLHTYCMKKFGHLLDEHQVAWVREEPLQSRVGKYVKRLTQERELQDITTLILKSSISIFDKFNYVRNNQSLAHDNVLPDQAEARFIYDSITAILRFIKQVEADHFGV